MKCLTLPLFLLARPVTSVSKSSKLRGVSDAVVKTASYKMTSFQEQWAWSSYESAVASQDLKQGVEIDPTQCDIERSYTARPDMCPQRVERWNYADLELSVIGFSQVWKEMQTFFFVMVAVLHGIQSSLCSVSFDG